jgi:hypothetical protein
VDFEDRLPLWESYQDKRMAQGWKLEKDRHPERLACWWKVDDAIVVAAMDYDGKIMEKTKKRK